jgi:transposase
MARAHKPYPDEFKEKLVALVRQGRTPEELSREFEPSAQAIRNWVVQADRDAGRREDGLTSTEREELQRLRRENERLREEREILKKAAAWFAQETKAAPNGSSNS